MQDLTPRYDDTGRLLGHDGAAYPKIDGPSDLERRLVRATRFPSKARRIAAAFGHALPPERTSAAERAALEKWLVASAPYLGSAAATHLAQLPARSPELAAFAAREAPSIARFLAEAADPPESDADPPEGQRRRVLILFGELGGGTRHVAKAVAGVLEDEGDFEPVTLSVNTDVVGEADPLYRVFGVYEHDLWNRHLLDSGDTDLIPQLEKARRALRDHFAPDTIERAAQVVARLRPAHVISTLPGLPLLSQIASARCPLTILHPDFGVNPSLCGKDPRGPFAPYRMFDPERVTIGLSSDLAEPLLDVMRETLGSGHERLLRVVGYPTRRAFEPPASKDELEGIRARLGVREDERVVLLMMGQNGDGGRLLDLARRLVQPRPEGAAPLRIVAVCGRSERVRRALETTLPPEAPGVRLRVEGLVEGDVIAGYMHLAAAPGETRRGVVVTKPGGATTAECARTGAFMLVLPAFPWEEGNLRFVMSRGAGRPCDEKDVLSAVEQALSEAPSVRAELPDFRSRLLHHLRTTPRGH